MNFNIYKQDLYHSPAEIKDWKEKNFLTLRQFLIPIGCSNWGKLLCGWNERKADGTILHHTYSATIDTTTFDLYLDCRPIKIFAKCMVLLFTRPVHIFFKTLYHLSMFDVTYAIFAAAQGHQTKKEALVHSFKSLADIVRTPLYGIAMMITNIAGMILGLIFPFTLYDTRKLLGKIEQSLNWGKVRTLGTHAPCFQPRSLIDLTHTAPYLIHEDDTVYSSRDPLEVSLAHFARSAIRWRRKRYNVFDQLWGTLDANAIYVSRTLEPLNVMLTQSNWRLINQFAQSF